MKRALVATALVAAAMAGMGSMRSSMDMDAMSMVGARMMTLDMGMIGQEMSMPVSMAMNVGGSAMPMASMKMRMLAP